MRRESGMEECGNTLGVQAPNEPLELSRQERSCPVSSMLLKGTGEVEANHQDARLGSEILWVRHEA